jgi:hypothetical protein
MVSTYIIVFMRSQVRILAQKPSNITDYFHVFLQSDSETWLIKSSRTKNVFELRRTSIIQNFKKVNNLLEKISITPIGVICTCACHTITATNCHFTWCSVVINVLFNAVKRLSTVSERIVKNKQ